MVPPRLSITALTVGAALTTSKLRRGAPVANNIYGVAQTIKSANYVCCQAHHLLFSLPTVEQSSKMFNEEIPNLHRGQGMEL